MNQPCFLVYWTDCNKLLNDSVAICLDDGLSEENVYFLLWQRKKRKRVQEHNAGELRREYFSNVEDAKESEYVNERRVLLFNPSSS